MSGKISVTVVQEMDCPNCGNSVPLGPYVKHHEGGEIKAAPNDVQCECGAWLRHTVPLFAVGPYGWVWNIIHPEMVRPFSEETL